MHSVITNRIDGIEVVVGFGKLAINPIKTRKVVEVELPNTAEFAAVKLKQDERNEFVKKASDEAKSCNEATERKKTRLRQNPQATTTDIDQEIVSAHKRKLAHVAQAEILEQDLKRDLLKPLKEKEKELRQEMAVYFSPKLGEYAKSEVEISSLRDVMAGLNGSGYVDLAGEIIEDNRGVVYCVEGATVWSVVKIQTLGVSIPSNAILYADLDEAQKKAVDLQLEIDAAMLLNETQKAAAKESAIQLAVSQAANLRSQLEIQGATDALEQSQEVYNARLAELDLIYG